MTSWTRPKWHVPRQPAGRYFEMEDFILAVTPRVASRSLLKQMKLEGRDPLVWRQIEILDKPIYGVIRDPKERACSGLRRLTEKQGSSWTEDDMEEFLVLHRGDTHVIPQVLVHCGQVDGWMKFEHFIPMLTQSLNRGRKVLFPQFPDWFEDAYALDYGARSVAMPNLFRL